MGVFGVPDAGAALRRLGVASAWEDGDAACGGAPVGRDSTGRVTVCGEVQLDNRVELRQALDLPGAKDAELLAELYHRHGVEAGMHALGMYAAAIWDARERQLVLIRDGVGARTSAAKSARLVSVSWPTAEITGIGDPAIARTTISSLNAHRSSIEPPPRATISTSGRSGSAFMPAIPAVTFSAAPSPCTGVGQSRTRQGKRSSSR